MALNSRAAGLFDVEVTKDCDGRASIAWQKQEAWRDWATLSEGCYLLRSNVTDWSPEELWKAYVLWKTLHQMAQAAGLGGEPRRVLAELSKISMIDVVLPTRRGVDIRRRCVTQPTEHQAILLQRLGLRLPRQEKD